MAQDGASKIFTVHFCFLEDKAIFHERFLLKALWKMIGHIWGFPYDHKFSCGERGWKWWRFAPFTFVFGFDLIEKNPLKHGFAILIVVLYFKDSAYTVFTWHIDTSRHYIYMFWNISSACTTTKSIPCRRPQFSRYFKKSLRIKWFLNARLTRGHRPRNSMPAMLDMFIRTFADAWLFCNERTFLSYVIKWYYTTWLILIVNDCRWFMFSEY